MALMDWLPLAAGGIAVYWLATRLAGYLMRTSKAPILAEHERAGAPREGRDKGSFSLFMRGAKSPFATTTRRLGSSRSARTTLPAPATTLMPVEKRREINREIAAKIESAAEDVDLNPSTEQLFEFDDTAAATAARDASKKPDGDLPAGPITSLDFTQDDALTPGNAAVATLGIDMPVSPLAMASSDDADEIGKTLLLDTEELLRAIRGGSTGNSAVGALGGAGPAAPALHRSLRTAPDPSLSTSVSSFGAAAVAGSPDNANESIDWTEALDGIPDWSAASPVVPAPSFFSAPQHGRDMAITQMFRPDPPALAHALPTAAPEDTLLDFRLPEALAATAIASISSHTPTEDRDEFHLLAVAHEDIQSARVALEELVELTAGPADPIFRALVFGAMASYARPFMSAAHHPALGRFPNARFCSAHEELLEARRRYLDRRDPRDDQLVRVPREGAGPEDDATFAVRTELLNHTRLPLYIELCNFLEMRLVEQLQQIGRDALVN